jgi:hypothetical protein
VNRVRGREEEEEDIAGRGNGLRLAIRSSTDQDNQRKEFKRELQCYKGENVLGFDPNTLSSTVLTIGAVTYQHDAQDQPMSQYKRNRRAMSHLFLDLSNPHKLESGHQSALLYDSTSGRHLFP